ncbi:FIG00602868: hypothetical protein [Olavius algarvensis Delta 1 endosymbiont]|nr:FIG00602868: hypothetical protein [Olavius algarvensis Delta 1 endosymbiont]
MAQIEEIKTETDLQFFGQISASISHELKNVLAIINENAGLLEDFTLMADRGVPLDPARLSAMAFGVQKQVERANRILNNMNRFAHSTDQILTTVDLVQTIELIMALTARFAAMQGVEVSLQPPGRPVALETAPYSLMHLVWLCLEFSMSAGGDEKKVAMVVEAAADSVQIRFGRLTGLTDAMLTAFPSDRERILLETLGAELTADPARNEIVIDMKTG